MHANHPQTSRVLRVNAGVVGLSSSDERRRSRVIIASSHRMVVWSSMTVDPKGSRAHSFALKALRHYSVKRGPPRLRGMRADAMPNYETGMLMSSNHHVVLALCVRVAVYSCRVSLTAVSRLLCRLQKATHSHCHIAILISIDLRSFRVASVPKMLQNDDHTGYSTSFKFPSFPKERRM